MRKIFAQAFVVSVEALIKYTYDIVSLEERFVPTVLLDSTRDEPENHRCPVPSPLQSIIEQLKLLPMKKCIFDTRGVSSDDICQLFRAAVDKSSA